MSARLVPTPAKDVKGICFGAFKIPRVLLVVRSVTHHREPVVHIVQP